MPALDLYRPCQCRQAGKRMAPRRGLLVAGRGAQPAPATGHQCCKNLLAATLPAAASGRPVCNNQKYPAKPVCSHSIHSHWPHAPYGHCVPPLPDGDGEVRVRGLAGESHPAGRPSLVQVCGRAQVNLWDMPESSVWHEHACVSSCMRNGLAGPS